MVGKEKKNRMKDYAKELYLMVAEDGSHFYSLQDIADRVTQELNESVTKTAIFHWAEKGNWQILYTKIKQYGIEKAEAERLGKEEQIKEKESDKVADIFKVCDGHYKMSVNIITKLLSEQMESGVVNFTPTELILINKDAREVILRLCAEEGGKDKFEDFFEAFGKIK